jgi:inner membrane protein
MSDQLPANTELRKQRKSHSIISSGGIKIAMLVILIFLLLIPVFMIRSLISERSYRAITVEESIMEAWGSQFTLYGPVIRIPVVGREEIRTKTEKDGEKVEVVMRNYALWITPRNAVIRADFSAQKKRRGIFSVALFSGNVSLSGDFSFERAKNELKQNQTMYPEQAEIIVGLASQKGIRRIIKAEWNGSELFFRPGNRNFFIGYSDDIKASTRFDMVGIGFSGGNGISASSPFDTTGINTFDIELAVQGGKSIRVLPVGEITFARIQTDWPSPSFQGGFLPANYTLSESGFDAEWEISYLSRPIPLYWLTDERGEYIGEGNWRNELFGVDFFKPLDHYALNTRAVKYAILFLIIPFLTLFFLEVFSQKSIHPAQYLLSGFANVVFYLLLLSISEHLSFSVAYLIAAAALTCMMTLYARSLLETWTRSAYMGLIMALLYLIMYLTLNAEDWALLIGSITAFVITGVVMFLTRRLDWSSLNLKADKKE